jgi:hypothetical protein
MFFLSNKQQVMIALITGKGGTKYRIFFNGAKLIVSIVSR